MKRIAILLAFFLITSCIPVRIAPTIKDNKVMIGKKFKRSLPKHYSFIFNDPKDADEFYNFINMKFDLKHKDVQWNVPFFIDGKEYFLSFHETNIPTKTVNLIPIAIDAKRQSNGNNALLEEIHVSRVGSWYLALTVFDSDIKDCLKPEYESRDKVIDYLKELKDEYLTTHDYIQALWRKN
jgi:hypothetical protein